MLKASEKFYIIWDIGFLHERVYHVKFYDQCPIKSWLAAIQDIKLRHIYVFTNYIMYRFNRTHIEYQQQRYMMNNKSNN